MNLRQYEFAEKFGVSKNSVIRYKANDRYPDPEFLVALADASVNINWLLKGDGEMFLLTTTDVTARRGRPRKLELMNGKYSQSAMLESLRNRTVILPVAAEIAAGIPNDFPVDYEFMKHIEIPKSYLSDDPDNYTVFRVNGKSMEPVINHADIVVIHHTTYWNEMNGKVCAVRTEDGITLKKVQFDDEKQQIILQPFNLDFKVQILDPNQDDRILIIGPMALQFRLY
jgi:SOS-response transcriptional repressor LexA